MSREERVARNEALFREVNERIKDVSEGVSAASETDFVCECGDAECTEPVSLTPVEYEEVRRDPTHFSSSPVTCIPTSRSSSPGTSASRWSRRTTRRPPASPFAKTPEVDARASDAGRARPPGCARTAVEAEERRPPAMPVRPTTGRFLFSLVSPQADCEVLEVGAGRGHSTIWFAAGVRFAGRPRRLSRARSRGGRGLAAEHHRCGPGGVGGADRGRRSRDPCRRGGCLRRHLPRREEGGVRAVLRAGQAPGRPRRPRSLPTTSSRTRRFSAPTAGRARAIRRSSASPSRSTAGSS